MGNVSSQLTVAGSFSIEHSELTFCLENDFSFEPWQSSLYKGLVPYFKVRPAVPTNLTLILTPEKSGEHKVGKRIKK